MMSAPPSGEAFSLKRRIIVIVISALVPLSLFSLYSANRMRDHIDMLAGARLVASANATAASQREAISMARLMLTSAVVNPDIINASERCPREMRVLMMGQQAIINMARLNAQGRVICSSLLSEKVISMAGQTWWQTGKAKQRMTLSPPAMSQVSREQVIVAMLPLYVSDARFDGAVTAGISTAWMKTTMRNLRLSSTAMVALADGDGKVVMQSGGPSLGQLSIAASGANYRIHESAAHGRWLYASAPIFGRELYVVFAEPQQKLLSNANRFWTQTLIAPIVTMILTSLAVWWGIQYQVVRWLGLLSDKGKAIAQGTYQPAQFDFSGAAPEIKDFARTLHQMSDDITAQKDELNSALAHSRRLAREINHRVKNNLQIVLSLLHMQIGRLPDGEARTILEKTLTRISAVSITQRLTYEESESVDHGTVDMCQLLETLAQQWQLSFSERIQKIEIDCDIRDFPSDKAIPLALIVVETVSNAMHHGFNENDSGTVMVKLRRTDGNRAVLSIVDDGRGFDHEHTPGQLGLNLVEALTLQVNGTLTIRSHAGTGTTLRVEMPMA